MVNGHLEQTYLYSKNVLPGKALTFENVNVSPGEPLKAAVQVTGKNDQAAPNYIVGIDRIEVRPARLHPPSGFAQSLAHEYTKIAEQPRPQSSTVY